MNRRGSRKSLAIPATYSLGPGWKRAFVLEFAPNGCRIWAPKLKARGNQRISVKPEGMEALRGTVKWIAGEEAGVEFDFALYGPVIDHLCQLYPLTREDVEGGDASEPGGERVAEGQA